MSFRKFPPRFFLLMLLISSFMSFKAIAQQKCSTMEHEQSLEQKNPQRALEREQSETILQNWITEHPGYSSLRNIDTIPVVVHVLWHTNIENIDSAQVLSQIDVLNEDYGRTNADTVDTPLSFLPVAGTVPYRFHLARRDADGNPTNGIERRYVSAISLATDDQIKTYAGGGLDAWDVKKYMNIWVINFGNTGILGYGEFPTNVPSNTFGVVIQYDAFGRVGTVTPPYNLGTTTTHEFSHCFNLFHIWGDDGGLCTGSDLVADTPNQGDATFGCPAFPYLDNCSSVSPGIMFMNFMDYTDDACMNMFTNGQVTRMVAAINSFYPTLLTSDGCVPGAVYANNASVPSVVSPSAGGQLCSATFSPVVTIKNWGSDTLNTVTINYRVDNNAIQIYNWSGAIPHLATTNVSLPSVSSNAGSHTLTAYTTNPNGTPDSLTANDTSSVSFSINTTVVSLPQQEGFQPTTFPPVNWYYVYSNPTNHWKRVGNAGGFGNSTASAKMDNFSGSSDITGQVDDLTMPNMNFTNAPDTISLAFNMAYAQYDNTLNDSLIVRATSDCGATWSTLFKKGGGSLSTAPDQTSAFTPTATQWKAYSLSLSQFVGQPKVKIVFRSVSSWGNNIYLDDVNIGQLTGIADNQMLSNVISISPNPSTGMFNIDFAQQMPGHRYDVKVLNEIGQVIRHASNVEGGSFSLDLSQHVNATYLILISDGAVVFSKKIVLQK